VCVVDDNVSLLASYGALLESANFTVVPYPSGAMLLADDKYLRAGCVLLDLHMPPPDGLETLRLIQMQPNPPVVIMITGEGDIPSAVKAMRLGAYDFAEKPIDGDVLINLVEAAILQQRSESDRGRPEKASLLESLTQRENEVLNFLLDGSTNKEIAIKMGISHRTVEVHRANLMSKTEAKSLSELVMMAMSKRGQADNGNANATH
jgi:two-component system response regulator FixJ